MQAMALVAVTLVVDQISKEHRSKANKAVADKYGLDLVAYEGGQHLLHAAALVASTASAANARTQVFRAIKKPPLSGPAPLRRRTRHLVANRR